jgi:hypothetical protein
VLAIGNFVDLFAKVEIAFLSELLRKVALADSMALSLFCSPKPACWNLDFARISPFFFIFVWFFVTHAAKALKQAFRETLEDAIHSLENG